MPTTLATSEIYGPTLQGEGPSLGRACAFLRTAGCNQHCSWCDTPFTWKWSEYDIDKEVHKLTTEQVVRRVLKVLPPVDPMLVISGGEPMLQQVKLLEVLELLRHRVGKIWVEAESAGTIPPQEEFNSQIDAYNISLKLEHSGNEKKLRYRPATIDVLQASGKVQGWKFVAQQESDLEEIDQLVKEHSLSPIFVMPEGVTQEDLAKHSKALVAPVIARGWRMTPRLHIQLWGSERGH